MSEEHTEEKTEASGHAALLSDSIPEKQWELPIGFDERGEKPVTLREMVGGTPNILSGAKLTEAQRARLVAQRIEAQNDFALSMYGVDGVIDKERAIREVLNCSSVGNTIAQVEMLMIEEMVSLARGEEPPA
ncbi:MAG: hypothetical protein QOJ76_1779 [Acidobacteriota bacterium]|jgi:hypothetical protein|nr:hypothetical protein [Acidobacteriota bacterium]